MGLWSSEFMPLLSVFNTFRRVVSPILYVFFDTVSPSVSLSLLIPCSSALTLPKHLLLMWNFRARTTVVCVFLSSVSASLFGLTRSLCIFSLFCLLCLFDTVCHYLAPRGGTVGCSTILNKRQNILKQLCWLLTCINARSMRITFSYSLLKIDIIYTSLHASAFEARHYDATARRCMDEITYGQLCTTYFCCIHIIIVNNLAA